MTTNNQEIVSFLEVTFPNAHCVLNFSTPFQCIVAVSLSAQTTDKAVNEVTPKLFEKYPDALTMSKASLEEIEELIKRIGLYHNKAKNLKALSDFVASNWNNEIILDFDQLTTLPGVGRKTANVVLAECANRPAIAVDTHVARVSKRLGLASENDQPEKIEDKLEKKFPKEIWIPFHHRMIFFGRFICHSQNPECDKCKLTHICKFYKKCSSKISK